MPLLPPDSLDSTPRSFYVTTTDIFDESQWSEPTFIDQPGIDPDLFFDDNGKVYATLSVDSTIWSAEIDITTGDSLSSWQQVQSTTVPCPLPQLAEGPHIYKINGTYYLLTAEVGTEAQHQSRIYRSQNVRGPWEDSPTNPLLFNGANLSQGLLSTGHADMVQAPDGNWWAVFLAARFYNPRNASGYRQLGRETYLTPVEWHDDGWPTFNQGKPITENMPGYLYDLPRPQIWRDDFDTKLADKNYYRIRTPLKETVDLTSKPGLARLHANPYTISNRASPSALLRKQQDVNVTFSTELTSFDLDGKPLLQEAGASVFLNDYFHHDIGVIKSNITNQKAIIVRISTGVVAVDLSALAGLVDSSGKCNTTETTTATTAAAMPYNQNVTIIEDEAVAAGSPVRFVIEGKEDGYRLGYAVKNAVEPIWVGEVSNRWLDASPLTNFEGSHFGIYNSGGGSASLAVADFEYVQTELN